jgi:hypothetical protein
MNDTLLPSQEEEEESRDSRRMDPEVLCLSRIARLLDTLDDDAARDRVVAYLRSRYSPRAT